MVSRRSILVGGGAVFGIGAGATYFGFRGMGTLDEYNAAVASTRAALSARPEIRDFVRYATLAANGHNTQPWQFRIAENQITILPDFSRRTPVVDPDDHHLFVSLGCAAENLTLAAAARGRIGGWRFEPANHGSAVFTHAAGPRTPSPLFDAIPLRQSTRAAYDGRAVSAADVSALAEAAAVPGVDAVLITDRAQINKMRDLVVAGNTMQMNDPAFIGELKAWLRFSPRDAMEKGDGLFSACSGNPTLPVWLGPKLFDLTFSTQSENKKYVRHMDTCAGVAVFAAELADPEHWVRAGRACQRFALQATALGLKHSFVNQPVEAPSLRPELASLVGLPGRRPDIVMRFGYGPDLPYSARRPATVI
jgi:nitroreductase